MPTDRMIRAYVAGAYSGPNVLTILDNIRRGLRAGYTVQKAGFAAFVPWTDWLLHLAEWGPAEEAMTLQDYYRMSMAWLEVCQCVIVVPERAVGSKGTQAEIARATELGIPVFWEETVEAAIEKAKAHFAPPADPADTKYPWLAVRKSDEHAVASFKTCRAATDYIAGMAGYPELPGTKNDYYAREWRSK